MLRSTKLLGNRHYIKLLQHFIIGVNHSIRISNYVIQLKPIFLKKEEKKGISIIPKSFKKPK
jgi:hypothetical protein